MNVLERGAPLGALAVVVQGSSMMMMMMMMIMNGDGASQKLCE